MNVNIHYTVCAKSVGLAAVIDSCRKPHEKELPIINKNPVYLFCILVYIKCPAERQAEHCDWMSHDRLHLILCLTTSFAFQLHTLDTLH